VLHFQAVFIGLLPIYSIFVSPNIYFMIKKLLVACFVILALENKAQTYYENIAHIFYSRCTSCHNQYGFFPLLNYTDAKNEAANILTQLQNGTMPPWPPDTTYTRFVHERLISTQEKNDVINWINGGMLYVDTTLAPPAPVYTRNKLHGIPSLVLQIPTYTSTAASSDKYICFSLPSGLLQDEMLRAYEVVPGNPQIVHHAVISVDTTGTVGSDYSGGCYTIPGDFSLGGFAPGEEPVVLPGVSPLKLGMRIKAGSNIILQMHYPKGSIGQLDSTQIRFYFYPQGTSGIRQVYATTPLQNWSMFMAANTVTTYTAQYPSGSSTLQVPISIYSIFPHSHHICTSLYDWASQGATTIPLVKINKWDFDWQGYYTYHNMVKIPAGYKLRASHTFDNTTNNPNNPNPVTVTAGTSTGDEMLFDAIMFTYYQNGDEFINIDTLLMNDSLLTTGIADHQPTAGIKVGAYPNPFQDKVTLGFELKQASFVSVVVYNAFGQEVATLYNGYEKAGWTTHDWDTKNSGKPIAPGLYIYKVMVDNKVHTGKLILKAKN